MFIETSESYGGTLTSAKQSGSGCRSLVPEDETHQLYFELFERLVHVPKSRRIAVIKALAAIYEI